MILLLFNKLTNKDKLYAVERLIAGSTPNQDFFFMIILSVLTATFGLLLNDIPIIIGSMLIAPMLYPILSLSLGITMSDGLLISRAFYTILKSFVFGVIASSILTLLFAHRFTDITPEIATRTVPSLIHILVAIIAGFAGSFAVVKPKLNENLTGIAISVSLIPPIAVVGIGIAKFNWTLVSGSFMLFVANSLGIVFAGLITFSMMDFYTKRRQAHKKADIEDKKILREKEEALKKAN